VNNATLVLGLTLLFQALLSVLYCSFSFSLF